MFEKSGKRFEQLDKRIAARIVAMCTGEFGRRISHEVEVALKETPSRSLKGRELIWFILNANATSKFWAANVQYL